MKGGINVYLRRDAIDQGYGILYPSCSDCLYNSVDGVYSRCSCIKNLNLISGKEFITTFHCWYLRRDGVGVYCCGKEGYYFKPKKEKLRLLVTPECHRGCAGCCNKDWNLNDLPVCNSFHGYNEIIITGGEPMLLGVERLIDLTRSIRRVNKGTKIFMYTSFVESPLMIAELFYHLEGITLTIHEKDDVDKLESFFYLYKFCRRRDFLGKMFMRLNVFKGIDYSSLPGLELWKVKDNITWQKNCPLPEGEVFMRLGSE